EQRDREDVRQTQQEQRVGAGDALHGGDGQVREVLIVLEDRKAEDPVADPVIEHAVAGGPRFGRAAHESVVENVVVQRERTARDLVRERDEVHDDGTERQCEPAARGECGTFQARPPREKAGTKAEPRVTGRWPTRDKVWCDASVWRGRASMRLFGGRPTPHVRAPRTARAWPSAPRS